MKVCAYCGRENDDDATHCRECGTAEFRREESAQPPQPIEPSSPAPFVPRTLSPAETQQAFITLRSCRSLEEADLLVTQLDAAGVTAMIPDEGLMQTVAWNVNTYGYVRVQVPTTQYDTAAQFLMESERSQQADTEIETDAKRKLAQEALPISMRCLLVLLPGTICPGLVIAAMIRSTYLNKGYQRRADEVWKYFAIGFVAWAILTISIAATRTR